jgi:hypothetical protein
MGGGASEVNTAARAALSIPIDRTLVLDCLKPEKFPTDGLFARALSEGLHSLDRSERSGALCGVTGHIAESVIEALLAELGWLPVWHFEGPGRHGVDLLLLDPPAERLFAVEVKGTLRPRRWPRVRRSEVTQMGAAWLEKLDNHGMHEWDLESVDIYGAVALVNFADLAYRMAVSNDVVTWQPIGDVDELADISWLTPEADSPDVG